MMRVAVVLPAPLGPTNPNSCPSATVKERSSGDHVAVAAGQALQFQHVAPLYRSPKSKAVI
jgi:hypothetical protein